MRTFGKSETEYFEFQLEGDDKIYRVPLAAYMPYSILIEMNEAEGSADGFSVQVKMLKKYMGAVVDDMSAGMLSDILKAWAEESRGAGASLGES